MIAQLIGVALLIAVVSLVCFTRVGRQLLEDAGDNLDEQQMKLRVAVRQVLCGLRPGGHAYLIHYSVGRMSLECSNCWHESPGFDIGSQGEQKNETRPALAAADRPRLRLLVPARDGANRHGHRR